MIFAIEITQDTFAPAKFANVSVLLNVVLPLATGGAALLFLAITLLAGFKIITHGDNPDEIKKSQQTIAFAVLGLVVVIISFLVVQLVGRILGITNVLPE
jgi:hypothetical protein